MTPGAILTAWFAISIIAGICWPLIGIGSHARRQSSHDTPGKGGDVGGGGGRVLHNGREQ